MRQLALDEYLSEKTRDNHINNRIYQHDLDHWVVGDHNCLSVPFDDLLAKGFNTRQTDVRPANSINTAFQLVAVIFQLQSLNQFGGVSATHLDWTMVPYLRKSFIKHYKDGLKYISNYNDDEVERFPFDLNEKITADIYTKNNSVYNYALNLTTDLKQENMKFYHLLIVFRNSSLV
jgi:ribonucleoside-triphosphate reductase